MTWYVLAIQSGSEARLARDMSCPVWYPKRTVWAKVRKHGGRRRERRQRPLFPGYLFLSLQPDQSNFFEISRKPGAFCFLNVDGSPIPLADDDVDKLQRQEAMGLYDQTQSVNYENIIGKEFQFDDGLLIGTKIHVDTVKNGQIVFTVLGSSLSMKISLEKFNKSAHHEIGRSESCGR